MTSFTANTGGSLSRTIILDVYSFPFMVIIELLHEYNKDPEKALYLLKEIIKLKDCDYIKELNNKGIHINTHINNYAKQLTKKINNSYHN